MTCKRKKKVGMSQVGKKTDSEKKLRKVKVNANDGAHIKFECPYTKKEMVLKLRDLTVGKIPDVQHSECVCYACFHCKDTHTMTLANFILGYDHELEERLMEKVCDIDLVYSNKQITNKNN